jgi:hypothetical protein
VRDPQAEWRAGRHLVVRHTEVSVQLPRSRGGCDARLGTALCGGLRATCRRRLLLLLLLRGPLLLAAEAAVHEQQAGAHGGER